MSVCAWACSCWQKKAKKQNKSPKIKIYGKHWNKGSNIDDSWSLLRYTATVGCYINAMTSAVLPRHPGLTPSGISLTKNSICLICIIHLIHAQVLKCKCPDVGHTIRLAQLRGDLLSGWTFQCSSERSFYIARKLTSSKLIWDISSSVKCTMTFWIQGTKPEIKKRSGK